MQFGLLIGVAIVVAAVYLFRRGLGDSSTLKAASRLEIHLSQRHDYLVFIALPTTKPDRWEQVKIDEGCHLVTETGQTIMVSDVEGFVVAYPSGQIADASRLATTPQCQLLTRGW